MFRSMRIYLVLLCFLLCSTKSGVEGVEIRENAITVISQVFCKSCLSDEEKMTKTTLEEVHSYAKLKHDPFLPLTASFTICSTIMTLHGWQPFFSLMINGTKWLTPYFFTADRGEALEAKFQLFFSHDLNRATISNVIFPGSWFEETHTNCS